MKKDKFKNFNKLYCMTLFYIQLMFVVCKMINFLNWSWIDIFLPTFISAIMSFVVKDIYVIVASIYEITSYAVEEYEKTKKKEITREDQINDLKRMHILYKNEIEEERIKELVKE